MSLKNVVLALALASLTGIAWLGLSASPAAANSPAAQSTKFDKEIGMSKNGNGTHHKGHHKGGRKGHHKGGHKGHKSK